MLYLSLFVYMVFERVNIMMNPDLLVCFSILHCCKRFSKNKRPVRTSMSGSVYGHPTDSYDGLIGSFEHPLDMQWIYMLCDHL